MIIGLILAYGLGYAWNPDVAVAHVGDTVRWKWASPPFITSGAQFAVWETIGNGTSNYNGMGFRSSRSGSYTGSCLLSVGYSQVDKLSNWLYDSSFRSSPDHRYVLAGEFEHKFDEVKTYFYSGPPIDNRGTVMQGAVSVVESTFRPYNLTIRVKEIEAVMALSGTQTLRGLCQNVYDPVEPLLGCTRELVNLLHDSCKLLRTQ